MDKYLKWIREMGFSTVTADDVRQPIKPEPPREEIVPLQRGARRHPAAGHIEAALSEAEELSNAYGLHGSAAMMTLKHLLELSLEELGGVSPSDSSSETAEGLRSVARWLRGGSAGSSQRDTRSSPGAVLCSAIVRPSSCAYAP